MKLASQQEVLDLLSIRTTTQSTDAIDRALETATTIAEAIIGTDMKRKTRLDRWIVPAEVVRRLNRGEGFQFFMKDGLLPEPRIKLWASSAALPTTSNSIVVPKDYYLVSIEEGVIYLTGTLLTGTTEESATLGSTGGLCSMMARYECGFTEDSEGVAQDVPQWLKDAAISVVVEVIRSHVVTFNKKEDIDDMSNQLTRAFRTQLYQKVRPRYAGVFPKHSEIV